MVFHCRGCGRELSVGDDGIRAGKFSAIRIVTIPPHPSRTGPCASGGKYQVVESDRTRELIEKN